MQTVAVVALRGFTHDGRLIHRGESVDLTPVQAAQHARCGNISLDRGRRPTYQTRDLVAAEPPQIVVTAVDPPPFIEPGEFDPTPKRRRGRPRKQRS